MHRIEIEYCSKCRWLLRSAWVAQELLSTFEEELGEVTLRKSGPGVFDVYLDRKLIWSREKREGFPEIKELKQIIRDEVAPGRDLGHVDRS